jgi:hypothetical protein
VLVTPAERLPTTLELAAWQAKARVYISHFESSIANSGGWRLFISVMQRRAPHKHIRLPSKSERLPVEVKRHRVASNIYVVADARAGNRWLDALSVLEKKLQNSRTNKRV